jgi:hypothetical protein
VFALEAEWLAVEVDLEFEMLLFTSVWLLVVDDPVELSDEPVEEVVEGADPVCEGVVEGADPVCEGVFQVPVCGF